MARTSSALLGILFCDVDAREWSVIMAPPPGPRWRLTDIAVLILVAGACYGVTVDVPPVPVDDSMVRFSKFMRRDIDEPVLMMSIADSLHEYIIESNDGGVDSAHVADVLSLLEPLAGRDLMLIGHEQRAVARSYKRTIVGSGGEVLHVREGVRNDERVYSFLDEALDVAMTCVLFGTEDGADVAGTPGKLWQLSVQFGPSHGYISLQISAENDEDGVRRVVVQEVHVDLLETVTEELVDDAFVRQGNGGHNPYVAEGVRISRSFFRDEEEAGRRRDARHDVRRRRAETGNGGAARPEGTRRSLPGCPTSVQAATLVLTIDHWLCSFLNAGICNRQSHYDHAETYALGLVAEVQRPYQLDFHVSPQVGEVRVIASSDSSGAMAWNNCNGGLVDRLQSYSTYFIEQLDGDNTAASMLMTVCHDNQTSIGAAYTGRVCVTDNEACCVR